MTNEDRIHSLEDQEAKWNAQIHALRDELQHIDPKLRYSCQHELEQLMEEWRHIRWRLARLRLKEAESYHDDNFLTAFHQVFDEIGARVDHLISSISQNQH